MGIGSFVRKRKAVKADRAESGSHQKLVSALSTGNGPKYQLTPHDDPYTFALDAAAGKRDNESNNVTQISAGSKPLTAKNSDWGDLPKY